MVTPLPGGVGVSGLTVYDWEAADGLCGGTPHMHLACSEAYIVIEGTGSVQTLTTSGYADTPLRPGDVVWFTPGTIHRLVNSGGLRLVVLMQNSGLPEAGDAVFTFPAPVLADPDGVLESQGPNSRSARRMTFTSVADVEQLSGTVVAYVAEAVGAAEAGLRVEPTEHELCDELKERLASDSELADAFELLTPGRRREYDIHIASAKRASTREARIDRVTPRILAGKGLRDR